MKELSYKKIFWGVLLVVIGILFILKNLGILSFSIFSIRYLIPLVLILWGISLVPLKDWIKLSVSIGIIVLFVIIIQQFDTKNHWFHSYGKEYVWNDETDDDDNESDSTANYSYNPIVQAYDAKTKNAILNMELAAASFNLAETSSNLIEVSQDKATNRYAMTANTVDSLTTIDVSMKNNKGANSKGSTTTIKLNSAPVWDVRMKVGAANADLDFTDFKTKSISIDGGAADIDLKIGSLYRETKIDISSGAASMNIKIPKDSGCEIVSNIVLGSKDFVGFEKVSKQNYRTSNYNTSKNKVYITLKAGVSSISVERY